MKMFNGKFLTIYLVFVVFFSIGTGMLMKYDQTGDPLHPTVVIPVFVIFLTSVSISSLIFFMVSRAQRYSQARLNKVIIPALLLFYVGAFLLANLSVALGDLGWFIFSGEDISGYWPALKNDLVFANGSFYVWLLFFTIAFFYVLWQKSAKKEQKLTEENLRHRYNTLKSQINPHFLFNSLNTLSELVYVDAKKSDSYIQTLAGIYRYVLENEDKDLVELEKELEFVKQYFSLQQVRDEGKISLEIDIHETNGIKIMPVSLQLLLENALKHNVSSIEMPMKIRIFQEGEYIVVSNPVQKKSILENSTQIGLSNLKDRTKIIMENELVITSENNYFTVKLPIQKQK